jgi:hypothetical protein
MLGDFLTVFYLICASILVFLIFLFFPKFLARFSPDDQYSKQRIEMKKRHKLLPTQQPPLTY